MRYTEYHCGVAVIKDRELFSAAMAKLARYEDQEEVGRLAELPCAVNDTVYTFVSTESGHIIKKMQVKEIQLKHRPFGDAVFLLEPVGRRGCLFKYYETDFGKVAFLTQEAAQTALEKMKGGANNE